MRESDIFWLISQYLTSRFPLIKSIGDWICAFRPINQGKHLAQILLDCFAIPLHLMISFARALLDKNHLGALDCVLIAGRSFQ